MRRRRRKLNPATLRLSKIADRAHIRATVLAVGIARQLERCYDYDEFKDILDIMATDLKPAFEADRDAQAAYDKACSTGRPNPVRTVRNPKKKAAKK